jgi:hypothetical protein
VVLVPVVEVPQTETCQTKMEIMGLVVLLLLLSLRTVKMEETLLAEVEQQKDWVDFTLPTLLRQRVHNRVVAVVAAMQNPERHMEVQLAAKDNLK